MSAAAHSRARKLPDLFPASAFRWSAAALLLAALAGPFWNVVLIALPAVSLTAGRALIVVAAAALVLDIRRAPRPLPRIERAVWLLLGALALLWVWIEANAQMWGCRCSGDSAGFSELIAIVALAALAATFEPRLRPALLLAVIGGAVLAALMTLGGVDGLSAGARNPSPDVSRLAGPYGNPNLLAFAIGFSIPAGVAVWWVCPPRIRVLLALALGLVGAVLVLTYSRGGMLAVAAGTALAFVLAQPRGGRARRGAVLGIVAVCLAIGLAYPMFADLRRDANSPDRAEASAVPDRSGWDGRTQGLIPGAPARMRNPSPDVLDVRTDGSGGGVSRALAPVAHGGSYELRFEARGSPRAQRLHFGLEDNLLGNGPAQSAATLGDGWRSMRLRWTPTADSRSARLYIWTPVASVGFQIRNIVAVTRAPNGAPIATPIATALKGPVPTRLEASRRRQESREIRSRVVGADLALDAFVSQPVRGIGWGRFTEFSTANSEFRGLPTHNEYLRVLAELGLVGVALLGLAGLAIASAFWRRPLDAVGIALIGMLVTGAIALVFVNGLTAVAIASPLGFAAAIACARAGPRDFVMASEASAWWPPRARAHSIVRPPARIRTFRAGLLGWIQAAAPRPAHFRARGRHALQRVRAAAPLPLPVGLGGPPHGVARGLELVRAAAPSIAPREWASALRVTEPAIRRPELVGARVPLARRITRMRVGSRTLWAAGIGTAALAVRMPLMLERHEIAPGGDSADYVGLARTFFDQGPASAVRPPGYPLFLAVAGALPGRLEDAAVVLQLLIGAGLCAAMVFVAWPLFGRLAAVLTGLLLALTAPFLSVEALLLADGLFGVLVTVVAGLIAAAALDERRRWRWLLAAGLAIACAAYVKPVGHALVLAPLLPLALATRSWRATLSGSGAVLLVVAVMSAPWMLRNETRYESFSMSDQTGATLFNRVFERDRLTIPTDDPTGRLAAEFRRRHPSRRLSSGVAAELVIRGDTPAEAQRKMRAVAIDAARDSPGAFAAGTLSATHDAFADVASGGGEDTIASVRTAGASLPTVTRIGLTAGAPLRAIWVLFALAGFSAALWFMSRSRATRVAAAASIGVWATVSMATAVFHGGAFRYSASLAPLTFLLAAAGVAVVVKAGLHVLAARPGTTLAPLVELVRDGATPSANRDAQVGSAVR